MSTALAALVRTHRALPETFGELVRHFRTRRGWSQNMLAHEAGIDPAYVNRMERLHDAAIPSRAVVLLLAEALGVEETDRDRMLVAAGYRPEAVPKWGDTYALVAAVLERDDISEARRLWFAQAVQAAARLVVEG